MPSFFEVGFFMLESLLSTMSSKKRRFQTFNFNIPKHFHFLLSRIFSPPIENVVPKNIQKFNLIKILFILLPNFTKPSQNVTNREDIKLMEDETPCQSINQKFSGLLKLNMIV